MPRRNLRRQTNDENFILFNIFFSFWTLKILATVIILPLPFFDTSQSLNCLLLLFVRFLTRWVCKKKISEKVIDSGIISDIWAFLSVYALELYSSFWNLSALLILFLRSSKHLKVQVNTSTLIIYAANQQQPLSRRLENLFTVYINRMFAVALFRVRNRLGIASQDLSSNSIETTVPLHLFPCFIQLFFICFPKWLLPLCLSFFAFVVLG